MNNIELIGVKPSEQPIDLSQAYSLQSGSIQTEEGSFEYSEDGLVDPFGQPARASNPTEELRRMLTSILENLKQSTSAVLTDQAKDVDSRFQQLTDNINPVLNELDHRLTTADNQIRILETAMSSFIRVWLASNKMSDEELTGHQNVLINFLQSTATITVELSDAKEESGE
jgi:hypothetical protein